MGWIQNIVEGISEKGLGKTLKKEGHLILDIAGMTPLIGNVADLANAYWYKSEGDNINAGLSLTAAIPGVGQFAGGAKIVAKTAANVTKTAKGVEGATTAAKKSLEGVKTAKSSLAANKGIVASPWMEPAKDRLVKGAQKELKSKGDLLKQARASQQTARKAGKVAQEEAAKLGTKRGLAVAAGKEYLDEPLKQTGRAFKEAYGQKGLRKLVGGDKGFGRGRFSNVALGGLSISERASDKKEPTTQKDPENPEGTKPEDTKPETDPLLGKDGNQAGATSKPKAFPIAELGGRLADNITEGIDAGIEAGKSSVEKAKKEQQDNYDKRAEITLEIDNKMTDDPDYYRKNRGAANVLFQKARRLGVTADQFNNYVRNNKTAAQDRRREIDRNEANQFRIDKLNQSVLEPLGSLTDRQKGENTRAYLESLGIAKVTPEQASSIMNRSSALQREKNNRNEKDPKKAKG